MKRVGVMWGGVVWVGEVAWAGLGGVRADGVECGSLDAPSPPLVEVCCLGAALKGPQLLPWGCPRAALGCPVKTQGFRMDWAEYI